MSSSEMRKHVRAEHQPQFKHNRAGSFLVLCGACSQWYDDEDEGCSGSAPSPAAKAKP